MKMDFEQQLQDLIALKQEYEDLKARQSVIESENSQLKEKNQSLVSAITTLEAAAAAAAALPKLTGPSEAET